MSYKLEFNKLSYREWQKLDASFKKQFKKKLAEILVKPIRPNARLRGLENCYKIKLKSSSYRLVYQVKEQRISVLVLAVGKRDNLAVYKAAMKRK